MRGTTGVSRGVHVTVTGDPGQLYKVDVFANDFARSAK